MSVNTFGRGVMARVSAVEDMLPVTAERPQPYVLLGLVVASTTLCGSDAYPFQCPVDGAGIAGGLDERLDEHGGGVEAFGPVLGQAMARRCEPRLEILIQG